MLNDTNTCRGPRCQRLVGPKSRCGLCTGHRQQVWAGKALAVLRCDMTIEDRFWPKVNKEGPTQAHMDTPCWVWTGARGGENYGELRIRNRNVLTHRLSFEFANGAPPTDCVLHRCDNPPCVRPDHLFAGSSSDNARDMWAKGRGCRGDRHHRAKLTEADVISIRRRFEPYCWTNGAAALAREYGLNKSSMSQAIHGRKWTHLPGSVPANWPGRGTAHGGCKIDKCPRHKPVRKRGNE